MTVIVARYSGVCHDCHHAITEGQEIRYRSDVDDWGLRRYIHANCDAANPEPSEGAVCPSCFIRRALSGECGCEA